MNQFEIKITYNRSLIRRALNHYFISVIGLPLLFITPCLAVLLLWQYCIGVQSAWVNIGLFLFSVAIALLAIVYLVRLSQSETFLSKMASATAIVSFSNEGVSTRSDLGSSTLAWSVFEKILKFNDMWLLVYARSGFITLPLESLSNECRVLIETKVSVAPDCHASRKG